MRRARRLNRPGLPGSSESAVMLSNDLQAEATLNLDFRSGVLDPRIDFQRTTTGTYYRGQFNQNLFRHSQDYTQAVWSAFASGTGSLPVITANAAVAPDGTMTANRVVMDRGNGTTSNDRSAVLSNQGLSLVVNAPYTLSVWMRGTVGGEVVAIRNAAATGVTVTLTTAWQRFSFTANALNSNPSMWVCGNVATTSALQVMTIEVWGAQLTEGSLLTPYIPTTTAAITQGQIAAAEPWNLFTQSQDIANAGTYTLVGATSANITATAPDGSTTVTQLTESNLNERHLVGRTAYTALPSIDFPVTISVYLKKVSRRYIQLVGISSATSSFSAIFDLDTGTITDTRSQSGSYLGGTMVDVGGGWYRCTISGFTSVAQTALNVVHSNVATFAAGSLSAQSLQYLGDGTSQTLVWGEQLNYGSTVLSYRSTTTAALWLPRFENDPITGDARGLLIEGVATNLQPSSTDFGGVNYARTNITVGTSITAPDGTATGGNISATTTATTQFRTGTITISATSVTASVFVKKQSLDTIAMRLYDTTAVAFVLETEYTFSTNTTTVTSGTGTLTATNVGNGWIRLALTTTAWTSGNGLRFFIHFMNTTANAGDSLYIWGVQVEAQSFASSYIPTTTATVARGADVALMTGTNFSSWYNQAEGTIFAISQGLPQGAPTGVLYQVDDGTNSERQLAFPASGGSSVQVTARTHDNGSINNAFAFSSVNSLLPIRVAYAYASGNYGGSCNGSNTQTAASSGVPTVNKLCVGLIASGTNSTWINAPISRLAYWPTRLPDATLQALTT